MTGRAVPRCTHSFSDTHKPLLLHWDLLEGSVLYVFVPFYVSFGSFIQVWDRCHQMFLFLHTMLLARRPLKSLLFGLNWFKAVRQERSDTCRPVYVCLFMVTLSLAYFRWNCFIYGAALAVTGYKRGCGAAMLFLWLLKGRCCLMSHYHYESDEQDEESKRCSWQLQECRMTC